MQFSDIQFYAAEAKAHTENYRHIAAVVKRGKILSIAANSVGSRARGCGWSHFTIHAERAAIKALGDLRLLDGAVLYVIRVPSETTDERVTATVPEMLESKPCHDCQIFLEKCMREYGLMKVFYSTTPADYAVSSTPPRKRGTRSAFGKSTKSWSTERKERERRATARRATAVEDAETKSAPFQMQIFYVNCVNTIQLTI